MSTVRLDYPGTATLRALWLRSGAEMLSDSIRDAGSTTPVWSWAEDRTVGFWLRKITHDTIIHRVDAEFTIGVQPALAPPTAVDGISDLLAAVSTLSAVDPTRTQSAGAPFATLDADGNLIEFFSWVR